MSGSLPTEHDALTAADQTLQAVERLVAPPHPEDAHGLYGWEPLPLPLFLTGMRAIGAAGPRRFLDAGCGIGTKVHLARMLGWQNVAGLERHRPYAEIAARLCPWAHIALGDARTFEGYDGFDVVYSYRLCVDDDAQRSLERLISSRMRSGTVAFFPQGLCDDLGDPLAADVWRVG